VSWKGGERTCGCRRLLEAGLPNGGYLMGDKVYRDSHGCTVHFVPLEARTSAYFIPSVALIPPCCAESRFLKRYMELNAMNVASPSHWY
jgi:hypothetical protein